MKLTRFTVLLIAPLLLLPSCKKDEAAILKADNEKTADADINKEISNLTKSIASAKDDFEKSDIYGKISGLQLEKGDIGLSEKNANNAIKFYPKSALPHYLLGKSLLSQRRLTEAETELKTAIEIDPAHALSWYELGNLNYVKAKYPEAAGMYQKAVSLNGKLYEAYNNLGSTYYLLKKGKESEDAFNHVLSIKSDFAPVYKNLGLLYERLLNNKEKAKADYLEYLKRRPNAPERAAVKFWIKSLEK